MENPIERALREKELGRNDFAILAGTSATRVWQFEVGQAPKLSGPVLQALTRLGYDEATMVREYAAWRVFRAQQIADRIRA